KEELNKAETELKNRYDNFLKQNQTYQEQRLAITKEYSELISVAEAEGNADAVARMRDVMNKELNKLDFDHFKKQFEKLNPDFQKVWTDISRVARDKLKEFKKILEE